MKCILNENDWCDRHQTIHIGRLKEISQMENDFGEKYRQLWDDVLIKPEKYALEPVDFSNCQQNIKQQSKITTSNITLYEKIKSFIKAWIKHAKNKFKNNEEAEQKRRLNICRMCVHRSPKINSPEEQWTCDKCGCWLKRKAKWAEQNCPLGYWDNKPPKPDGCGCSK